MAIRLAKYFGNSEQFWLNLQDALCGVSRQEEILQGTQRH
jgi:plasmid maintenance system antidote protein VapI